MAHPTDDSQSATGDRPRRSMAARPPRPVSRRWAPPQGSGVELPAPVEPTEVPYADPLEHDLPTEPAPATRPLVPTGPSPIDTTETDFWEPTDRGGPFERRPDANRPSRFLGLRPRHRGAAAARPDEPVATTDGPPPVPVVNAPALEEPGPQPPRTKPAEPDDREKPLDQAPVRRRVGVVEVVVAVLTVAAVAGLALLWPTDVTSADAGESVAREYAVVESIEPLDCSSVAVSNQVPAGAGECATVTAELEDGGPAGFVIDATQQRKGVAEGDRVLLRRVTDADGAVTGYSLVDTDRRLPLALVVGVLVVAAVSVAALRGARAVVVGTAASALLAFFVLPAIRDGSPPAAVALVASVLIGVAAAYGVHGLSRSSSVAALGTVVGVVLVAGLGTAASALAGLSGAPGDTGRRLLLDSPDLDVGQVTTAAAVIAALGVLIEATSRRARQVSPLRDDAAGSVLTLGFAFAGAGLVSLLVASGQNEGPVAVLNDELVATELVRLTVCGLGALLALPVTDWLARRLSPRAQQ